MTPPNRHQVRTFAATLCAALTLLVATSSAAVAADCATAVPYPGDHATKPALAQWLAAGARARGLPGELPVMGALVESSVSNQQAGGGDRAGFFGMRISIWNTGAYAGFPDNPELQLMWFVDHAIIMHEQQIAAGNLAHGVDPTGWGGWVADVLRPAAQDRGLYAWRLDDARRLIGPACAGWPPVVAPPIATPLPPAAPAPPEPPPPTVTTQSPAPDTTAPSARLGGSTRQAAVARGAVVVTATCPTERCRVSATGTLAIPGATRPLALRATTRVLVAGQRVSLRLPLSLRARRAARRALRQRPTLRATIRVVVTDEAQNRAISKRVVRITG